MIMAGSLGNITTVAGAILNLIIATSYNNSNQLNYNHQINNTSIKLIKPTLIRNARLVDQHEVIHVQQALPAPKKHHLTSATNLIFDESEDGKLIVNNITLEVCSDILKLPEMYRCSLMDLVEDCDNDEGFIDYTALFFCAFNPEKFAFAIILSILWLLTLFIATGVTATDFLCPALFMISKTLGLSQNIAGVTLLAFGNTSADIFAAINGIRLGKPDLVISFLIKFLGSGTLITTGIVGSVIAIKEFRLDKFIFVRDNLFYIAAVCLLFYIFTVPGRINLIDSIYLFGLYLLYVIVVLISKRFIQDQPLQSLHGNGGDKDGEIEFEGVQVDDDPDANMVVMRGFFFIPDITKHPPQIITPSELPIRSAMMTRPIFKIDEVSNGDTISSPGNLDQGGINSSLTTQTTKSARRVTLFEDNLFNGSSNLNVDSNITQRSQRSASVLSISKQHLATLRRASKDIRRQSMEFLSSVSPIDVDLWKQQNWGGRTMGLVKAPIRLFLLLTTPIADIEGREVWNKPLNILHCITGPIFVTFAFGFGNYYIADKVPLLLVVFLCTTPVSLIIIFTSSSETPPFYYNAYSSYLGFIVAITWIYTISTEVINLLRALCMVFNLSNEIMGLTILAWGNCMLDMITNISIASKGYPKMAVAACYGGPLMSTLLGIGLSSFVTLLIDPNHNTTLGASPLLYIIFCFLLFALVTTLILTIIFKFQAKPAVGYYLIALYIVMIIAEWLAELKFITIW